MTQDRRVAEVIETSHALRTIKQGDRQEWHLSQASLQYRGGVQNSCHPEERGISSNTTYVRGNYEIPRSLGMTHCVRIALEPQRQALQRAQEASPPANFINGRVQP